MKLTTRPASQAGTMIVELTEDHLDASNVKGFKEAMDSILNQNQNILLDAHRVDFIDSSGLGSLLSCLRAMNNKGGRLKLLALSQPVRALFELVRMHRVFEIYNDEAEASASV